MINIPHAKEKCKDPINMIENYDKAIADTTQTWICHHRDEVKILPSGIKVRRSMQDLIDAGRYLKCPANELIFLTPSEHNTLHHGSDTFTAEHRANLSKAIKGKRRSKPAWNKGTSYSAEQKKNKQNLVNEYHAHKANGGTLSWNEFQKLKSFSNV